MNEVKKQIKQPTRRWLCARCARGIEVWSYGRTGTCDVCGEPGVLCCQEFLK